MSSGDKSKSKSVSLAPELWERVEAKAQAEYGGNRSSYIRDLAEADLAGGVAPSPDAKDAIVRLAAAFHPTVRDALAIQLNDSGTGLPVNQPRLIARFLDALLHAMERKGGFDANGTFQLWESEHVLKQAFTLNPALGNFVAGVNEPPGSLEIPTAEDIRRAKAEVDSHVTKLHALSPGSRPQPKT